MSRNDNQAPAAENRTLTGTDAPQAAVPEGEKETSTPVVLRGISLDTIESELKKENHKHTYRRVFRSTIYILITVAAVAVLIAVLLLPVLQISGSSMADTLFDGDIVVALNTSKFETGDVVAFYYNNNILVKRVIATAGDWVDIDEDGNVFVNDVQLDEPYVTDKALGDCNITLPYQVPEGKCFLMGDHRSISLDSRNSSIGCIGEDLIIGRIFFRVWPLSEFGLVTG